MYPGEVLWNNFLIPFGITPYRLAKSMGIDQPRIASILRGKRAITADTAIRLSRVLNTTPEFWLDLQMDYDLEIALQNNSYENIEEL